MFSPERTVYHGCRKELLGFPAQGCTNPLKRREAKRGILNYRLRIAAHLATSNQKMDK